MSIFTRRPGLRWMVPAGIAVAVIGGGAATRAVVASADPSLPERSAAQLLVDLQTAKVDGVSGTVVQRADLGLPSLPNIGGESSTSLTSLLSGTHTLRVWYSGPDKARIALLGTLGETDVIADGQDLWVWDSRQNTATHSKVNGAGTRRAAPSPSALPSALPSTPQEAADYALKAIDPTTVVTTAGSARVAGRSAYELVLRPKDTASLVGQIRIAIDAKEHVPLRAQVYAAGSDNAAFEVAFTQVNFARPDDAQFRFNPPPGAKVIEEPSSTDSGAEKPGADPAAQPPTVIGTGWTSVLVTGVSPDDLPGLGSTGTGSTGTRANGTGDRADGTGQSGQDQIDAMLSSLPRVSGAWGSGRVLSGTLFSVLITDDGRLLAGAVKPERLAEAAADPAAQRTAK